MSGDHGTAAGHPLAEVAHTPGVGKPDPILVVENMRRAFGGLVAVDVDHLEIQRGVITALIGPNGAGKTTFFNLLTGFDRPDTGSVVFDGRDVERLRSHGRARQGMVRTFQLTKALTKLSVMENMKLGAKDQIGEGFIQSLFPFLWRSQEEAIEERARELLERFSLSHMATEYSGTLSGGQRKLLEMARALMASPAVVMLDEPVAGVNPALTQSLLEHVKRLPEEGATVIFVEHDMDVVWDISDWVVVMAEGAVIAEGIPESIGKNQAVIDAYLGSGHGIDDFEEEEV